MWTRRIAVVLIGLMAGLFDATISTWLPGNLTAIRFALPVVVILAAFSTTERAVSAALTAGVVLDVLMPTFGFITLRYVVVVLVVYALSQGVVTNRSLVGANALGLIGLLLDRILLGAFNLLRSFLHRPFVSEVRAAWWAEAFMMVIAVSAVFLLFAAFTRRFLPLLSRASRESRIQTF